MRFQPPTITWRGRLAQLVAQVQEMRPKHGESSGTMPCICGARLWWWINSSGASRAHCSAGCGAKWCH